MYALDGGWVDVAFLPQFQGGVDEGVTHATGGPRLENSLEDVEPLTQTVSESVGGVDASVETC